MRRIVHLDADAFFAAVEQAADPRLRGKPVAVGGEKRGIIASASYEARRFGVYTPMPTSRARKLCPKLIIVPGDFEKYEMFSRWMFSYAYDFTPDVEIGSIDEGYLDLTGAGKPATEIAAIIRKAICDKLMITVSEGIAASKLVSQIASKLNKPAGFCCVRPGFEKSFLYPLPNRWLPGIGPKTSERLNAAGLTKIQRIAETPVEFLSMLVGSTAPQLFNFANGIDHRPVIPVSEPAKSYSHQQTFEVDQTDEEFLEATLCRMADDLMVKVRADGKAVRTLTVRVRYNDMAEDQCGESLEEPTDLETDLYSPIRKLLRKAWKRRVSLRLVSLKLTNLYDGCFHSELTLTTEAQQRQARRRLADAIDSLRNTHGERIIFRGHDFILHSTKESSELKEAPPEIGYRTHPSRTVASTFIPLNVRSYYSFLNSTLSIDEIIKLAAHYELPAIALADQNNLHGAVEFAQAAKAAGIKPILGAAITVAGKRLQLYVENSVGYGNLCRILTDQKDFSPEATEGLVGISSDPELASFFPKRFYLEISDPRQLRRFSGCPLPCVAAPPIHYAQASDRWKFDVVQSIRTLTLLRQDHPEKLTEPDLHFPAPNEWQGLFPPELLAHTKEIADRCNFELSFGHPQFPPFTPTDGSSPAQFLRRLVFDGLKARYRERARNYIPQIEQELSIIHDVGYEEYFLVVWEILGECRRHGIDWITRGSAADSMVCYALGISDVCPIRFELYFRRFLNKERMSLNKLPDIDIDFPHDRKDDVVDLIFEKYTAKHTAVVGGFSTYQARSALGDVAKVLGVSEYQIRRVTERLPHYTNASYIAEAVAHTRECADLPFNEEPYRTALLMADFLNGFPRHAKMHPCGLVLSRQPIRELVPCFTSNKGYPTTHFDMDSVEAIGLVKMDILAQGGLAAMRDALNSISLKQTLPTEPPKPHTTISSSDTGITSSFSPREKAGMRGNAASEHPHSQNHPTQIPHPPKSPPSPQLSSTEPPKPQTIISSSNNGITSPFSPREKAGMRGNAASEHPSSHPQLQTLQIHPYPHSPRHPESQPTPAPSTTTPTPTHLQSSQFNWTQLEPWQDPEVWEMIANGGARAVHHIESPAMISLCRMCNVRDIDTLVAIVSVIRPGAANESRKLEFTRRYQGLSPITYPHPSVEECLRSSYGLVVYEEQILQMCEAFSGLPPGRADVLRRALGKDKTEVISQIHDEFIAAARALGRTEKEIEQIWALIDAFRGYAFCKAHSTAYGVEAYQAAWLKRYYPAEFMAAVLTNGKGFYQPLVYVLECHRLGIGLLPPCVNEPGPQFMVVRDATSPKIRLPIGYIKGLSENLVQRILSARQNGPFISLADFFYRTCPVPEEMELLLRAGAFDVFGNPRTAQFWEIQFLLQSSDLQSPNQLWLLPPGNTNHLPATVLEEPTRRQRLEWEAGLFGFPASGHPLELHDNIEWDTYCPVNRMREHIGEEVVTCGLIIEERLHHQITGELMKFITIADWTGMIETELFAKTYKTYGLATVRYPVLEITARVEPFDNARGFSLRVLHAGKPRTK